MNRIQERIDRSRPTRRRLIVALAINTVGLIIAIGVLAYLVTRPLSGTTVDGLTLDGETLLQEQAAAAGRAVRDHYFIDRQGIIRARAFGALSREEMEGYVAGVESSEPVRP